MTVSLAQCVHCGFCLPACPTYNVLGNEADSPRGRLVLMDALDSGRIEPSAPVLAHLDACLLCRACESACPSGVAYGSQLQRIRATHRNSTARPWSERILERLALWAVTLPSWVHDLGAAVARALSGTGFVQDLAGRPGRIGTAARLMRSADWSSTPLPSVTPAVARSSGTRTLRVGLLEGCVGRVLFSKVNAATVRLLTVSGCEVVVPDRQRCCGALHAHAGDLDGARALARTNIAAFERAGALEAVVVNAAGCGSTLAEYGELLADDPAWAERAHAFSASVKDALELLDERGLPGKPATPGTQTRRVAYHDACHLAHARGVREAPRRLLSALPGIELVPLQDADRCCGSAGIYNLLHPHTADAILDEKLGRLAASGADVAAAANPGCLLHLAAGIERSGACLELVHPIELLDQALDA
jgi:glycolate oxidase iron-sulfur subunit